MKKLVIIAIAAFLLGLAAPAIADVVVSRTIKSVTLADVTWFHISRVDGTSDVVVSVGLELKDDQGDIYRSGVSYEVETLSAASKTAIRNVLQAEVLPQVNANLAAIVTGQ